jgi:hypothetical protein
MPIPYDSTRKSLYTPEWLSTVFEPAKPYTEAQICVEASRLAYLKFETSTTEKDKLSAALSLVGYTQTECRSDLSTQLAATFNPGTQTALIAFRGTQSCDISDLATDAHFT